MAEQVRITDVSPRDGLQNEPSVIPTADKVRLIELLSATGVDEVEITSFVSPKWVPQLGDAAEVCAETSRRLAKDGLSRPLFSALVPNSKGWAALNQVNIDTVGIEADAGVEFPEALISKASVFTAASETFCQRNINATIAESIQRFLQMFKEISIPGLTGIRGYISCAIACPFEGPIHPSKVADVAARLVDINVTELDLGDTIGAGTPDTVAAMLTAVRDRVGDGWFERRAVTLHLHDTFGRAADCVKTALDLGIRSFDGSVAGLGGCPYASTPGNRAPGNISTELLVRTIEHAGYKTSVNLDKLDEAARFATQIVTKARAQAARVDVGPSGGGSS